MTSAPGPGTCRRACWSPPPSPPCSLLRRPRVYNKYSKITNIFDILFTEVGEAAPHQPAREGHKLGAGLQILTVLTGFGQETETIVLEHVHTLVIRPQIVYLLPETQTRYLSMFCVCVYADLNTATQKSLQMNFSRSNSSLNLG